MFAWCIIGIIVVNWLANYFFINDFGLYIDDYYRIPVMMQAIREGYKAVISLILSSPLNVRPLHGDLIHAFSLLGLKLGGIPGIYLIGFLILSINSFLAFLLLRRITGNFVCAFIGALALVLYPVTTVKIWLTAALGIQPALTLLLLSFIFYVQGRRILPYVLTAISLFSYETFFWVFISAPLLVGRWSRKLFYRVILHVAILSSIFILFFAFKSVDLDPRLADNSIKNLFFISVNHSIIGPCFNLAGNLWIPIKTLIKLNWMNLFFGVICAFGLFFILIKTGLRETPYRQSEGNVEGIDPEDATTSPTVSNPWRVLLVGLIMLISAYPLSFLGTVRTFYGIGSRLHLAGVIGVSFIYAGIGGLTIRFAGSINKRKIGFAILSVWLSLLIVYNFQVQKDYRRARNIQRGFWTELTTLCPDMTDGTLVFFYPGEHDLVKSISPFDWSTSFVLDKLYDFPSKWAHPPNVYVIDKDGWRNILFSGANLTLSDLAKKHIIEIVDRSDIRRKIETNKSIFLVYENGSLRRLARGVLPGGGSFREKPGDYQLKDLKKGVLYSYLVGGK
jgi:hypothetical protein